MRFNGAAFFQSGKFAAQSDRTLYRRELQWSRFFSKRKMAFSGVLLDVTPRLQWSRFFSKRKMSGQSATVTPRRRFNGAAFFQSGKCPARWKPGWATCEASMEPLFFKAENRLPPTTPRRSFSTASMEPLFFKAENTANGPACWNPARRLQWSRFFSKRKIAYLGCSIAGYRCASMEPLFFKAENCYGRVVTAVAQTASMEPLFFKAENIHAGFANLAFWGCFNGAAFFQSGKCLRHGEAGKSARRFNGAAFFQSGKYSNLEDGV